MRAQSARQIIVYNKACYMRALLYNLTMNVVWETFLLTFVPLFVAMDALGTVPIFLSLSKNLSPQKRKRLVRNSALTAAIVALAFILAGQALFRLLGITADDFRIGGGIILLTLAIKDLLVEETAKTVGIGDDQVLGVVPIGIPLIMGPAAMTTLMILVENHGYTLTLVSLVLNIFIVWITFSYSGFIQKALGNSGASVVAKVAALFMAAIAVMMIRVGIKNSF
jgi:multiple antibiotic resistance protein